jgi:hypothetical protein
MPIWYEEGERPADNRVDRAMWLVDALTALWQTVRDCPGLVAPALAGRHPRDTPHPARVQPSWSAPINDFIDARCAVFDGVNVDAGATRALHAAYAAVARPLLRAHLAQARITEQEFARIVAHTKDNPELSEVVSDNVVAIEDFPAFVKVRGSD